MKFDNIPLELKQYPYWCVWKLEQDTKGRPTKKPYNPKTGTLAKSNTKSTFAPFEDARAAYTAGGYSGLGVGLFDGLCAIDADHCIEDGKLSDVAMEIFSAMSSFSEISPSGSGLHIFFTAPGLAFDKSRYYTNNQNAGFEIYLSGQTNRFLTITGDYYMFPLPVADRTEQAQAFLDKYMLKEQRAERDILPLPDPLPPLLTDEQIIERLHNEPDQKFAALFDTGNWQDYKEYPSQSEADQALMNKLAFYCRRDMEAMDRLFRRSALYRPEKEHAIRFTAETAVRGCAVVYDPTSPEYRQKQIERDFADTGSVSVERIINPLDNKDRYSPNDKGNGYLLADLFADTLRFCPQAKCWYVYSAGQWRIDSGNSAVNECAKGLSNYLFRFLPDDESRETRIKNATGLNNRAPRERMLKDAQSVYPLALEKLDTNPDLLNVQNGTLNLSTGAFQAHSAADMISKQAGAAFMPGADCPLWKKTLAEIFEGKPELVRYLQKVLGYALLADPVEKQFYLLYGASTNNGKSTITQTVERLFGDYAVNTSPETIAEKKYKDSSRPSGDRARLAGVRFVSINEPERGMKLDEAYVKAITGRDTQTARHLNQSEFQYQVQFIMFIGTNHLPYVSDQTLFGSGRVRVIPIERSFTEAEQDKTLVKCLCQPQELSGILNWALEGLAAYRREGLTLPPAVEASVNEYRRTSDNVLRFMEDHTERDLGGAVSVMELWSAFANWCSGENMQSMTLKSFSLALQERGHKTERCRMPNSTTQSTVIPGIKCTFSSV